MHITEAYLEPSQTCNMDFFSWTVDGFAKSLILGGWLSSEYASGKGENNFMHET